MDASQEIAIYLRYHCASQLITHNEFGEIQSDIDLKGEEIILRHLKKSNCVYSAMS